MFLLFVGALETVKAEPRVWIDRTEADFGRVKRGESVREIFRIENHGDEDLHISDAQVSMPGITIRVQKTLAKGEHTDLQILWDTSAFQQSVEATVRLTLDDPLAPSLNLIVKGIVYGAVDVIPYPLAFLSIFSGETKSRELEIVNNQEQPLRILRLEQKGESFQATINPIQDGQRYTLKISARANANIGKHHEFLILHTDSPERPRIGIQVNVLVKPEVYLTPDSIDFGPVRLMDIQNPSTRNFLTQTLVIQRHRNKMNISDISSDIDILIYGSDPPGPSSVFRVDIKLDPNKVHLGKFTGSIIIATDDPDHPTLEVPVYGEITE